MAFTSLRASAEYESTASGATLTFSPSSDIEVGDTIVIGWCVNIINASLVTCADNSSQAGTANDYVNRPELTGTAFTSGTVYINKVTRKILTTDVITVTTDVSSTRTGGQMMAFVAGNANPRFESRVFASSDASSPVGQTATGALYSAASLVVDFNFWKGGAVASGIAVTTPTGSTACPGGGALSGGVTTRVECNANYVLDTTGTTGATTFTPSCTYTSITLAHAETLIFSDELPSVPPLIRSVGAAGGGAFGAGLTPNLPAFPQPDDLMLLFITAEESTTAISTPSGWTSMGASIQVTGGGRLQIFWKIWTSPFGTAPTLTYTPTTDGIETCMICIHADTFDASSPIDLYTTGSEATVDTSFSFNVSGSSPTKDDCHAFVVVTSGFDSGTGQTTGTAANTQLTGEVQRASMQTAGGLGAGFGIASSPTGVATNLGTWTQTMANATAKVYASFVVMPYPSGGPVALAMTSTGTGTSAFGLKAIRALAFTSTGTGTTTFSPFNRKRPLALTSTGSGTSAMTMLRWRSLSLTSTGTGTSAFGLKAKRALSFTSTGTGTSAFDLKAKRALAFTSTGVGTSAFGLKAKRAFAMTSTGAGTTSFSLSRARALAFTSTGTGTTSFTMIRWRPLAFTSAGSGTSSFGLKAKRALAFTSTGSSTSVFDLKAKRALALSSTGSGTTSLTMRRWRTMSISSTGSGTTTLDMHAKRALSFTSTGTGTSVFGLVGITPGGIKNLVMTSTGTGTTSFSPFNVKRALTLASTGTGTSAFALTAKRALALTSTGVGTSAFALRAKRALALSSTGSGTSSFTLAAKRALTLTSTGAATTSFSLRAKRALALSSTGSGTSTMTLARVRGLTLTSAGVGTTTFNLHVREAIALVSPGVGTTQFALTAKRALFFNSTGVGTTQFNFTLVGTAVMGGGGSWLTGYAFPANRRDAFPANRPDAWRRPTRS